MGEQEDRANVPQELLYTQTHEWARVEGRVGTVGITDHAQEAMRTIVLVELPEVGQRIRRGEELGTMESDKAVCAYHSPFTGEVVEVNEGLLEDPGLINLSPYEAGWLCKLSVADPKDLSLLLTAAGYERYCREGEG